MPKNNKPNRNQSGGHCSATTNPPKREPAPASSEQPPPTGRERGPTGRDESPSYKSLWKEIGAIDVINCIAGIGVLIVAIAALITARDTRDVKNAVANISALATQTQKEAQAAQGQLREMQAEQRPWIGLYGFKPMSKPTENKNLFIAVSYIVAGHLPGLHIKSVFAALPVYVPNVPSIPLTPCQECGDGDMALPGVPISKTPHVEGAELTKAFITALKRNEAWIWVIGRIDYLDPANVSHKTFICEQVSWDASFRSCDAPNSNYAD